MQIERLVKDCISHMTREAVGSDMLCSSIVRLTADLKQKRVVIYPAGYLGQHLQKTLAEYGVEVECFIDRAAGTIKQIRDIPVHEPEQLAAFSEETVVLVAVNLDSMLEQLTANAKRYNDRIPVLNGAEVTRLLRYPLCSAKLDKGGQFDLIECENCGFERHGCGICMSYLRDVGRARVMDNDWRSRAFTWFGYIVGQACTLKCMHCCEAIPFQREHKFVPKDVIVADVRKVAAASHFLTFVELIGGEPFLHPEFREIVQELLKIENIGYIKSFTNATIVPDAELCRILKSPRFMLQISNYEKQATGSLLDNIHETRRVLKEQGVPYIFTQNFEWQDFTSFDLHNTDETRVRQIFEACPLRNCNRLYKGMLYRCPHQYAGIELGELKRYPVECVDIHSLDERALADALEAFEDVGYIDACRHCLMPFDAPTVPAGMQVQTDKGRGQYLNPQDMSEETL